MRVTVLLADAGQSDGSGKVHALGLGWTVVDGPTTQPMAVIIFVVFDRVHAAVGTHGVVLRLLDEGEQAVVDPEGQAIVVQAEISVGSAVDDIADAPGSAHLIVSIGPGLPLAPGRRYHWEAVVDGQTEHRALAPFVTRPPSTTSD